MLTLKQVNHAEGEWGQGGTGEEGGEAILKKLILKKNNPHGVKKPYHTEQITCHKQKRNRKERQMDEQG